jgi:hypothetical protein
MSKVRFHNFGNDQTYHLFKWVTEGGAVDADHLIAQAIERVKGDETARKGSTISYAVRDKLAELLSALVKEAFDERSEWPLHSDMGVIGDVADDAESLLFPILGKALADINYGAAAEALLISRGKWNQERKAAEGG